MLHCWNPYIWSCSLSFTHLCILDDLLRFDLLNNKRERLTILNLLKKTSILAWNCISSVRQWKRKFQISCGSKNASNCLDSWKSQAKCIILVLYLHLHCSLGTRFDPSDTKIKALVWCWYICTLLLVTDIFTLNLFCLLTMCLLDSRISTVLVLLMLTLDSSV